MTSSGQNVCLPLPNEITNSITTYEAREQFLVKYIEKLLPKSDNKDVLEELQRMFFLDKHKSSRGQKETKGIKAKKRSKQKLFGHWLLGSKHGLLYNELLPMNEMWIEYMRQNLGMQNFKNLPKSPIDFNWETVNQRLLKADYHGAVISVVRSKNSSTVGIKGIVLQETKNCFRIITPKNRLRTLAKDSTLFKFHLPEAYLEAYGKELSFKPAERSVKKFKAIHLGEL